RLTRAERLELLVGVRGRRLHRAAVDAEVVRLLARLWIGQAPVAAPADAENVRQAAHPGGVGPELVRGGAAHDAAGGDLPVADELAQHAESHARGAGIAGLEDEPRAHPRDGRAARLLVVRQPAGRALRQRILTLRAA